MNPFLAAYLAGAIFWTGFSLGAWARPKLGDTYAFGLGDAVAIPFWPLVMIFAILFAKRPPP